MAEETSIFDSILGGVADIVDIGLDIVGFEKQAELTAQETGVKQVIAETDLARQQLEAQRLQAESDNLFFKTSTIQQVALIGGVAATAISALFLIFGGEDG